MENVEAYLRGVAWPAGAGAIYPRANPADVGRLPADTWSTATLPVGVRLEASGDASAIELAYRTTTDEFGYRGLGAGATFSVWRDGELVDEQPAVLGEASVRLDLGSALVDRSIVYLPEGMKPAITKVTAVGGTITPATPQPKWVAYGDSIVEGWIASGPSGAWPAIVGRALHLDVVNLGYAGSARGEIVSAENVASLTADIISITHGTNCWTRIPHSVEQMAANTVAFLHVVRAGHPGTPIIVAGPIVRPDAEDTPNKLGATLADLRSAMEHATQSVIDAGDDLITLMPGRHLLDASLLADGVHPGDAGHTELARVFAAVLASRLSQ